MRYNVFAVVLVLVMDGLIPVRAFAPQYRSVSSSLVQYDRGYDHALFSFFNRGSNNDDSGDGDFYDDLDQRPMRSANPPNRQYSDLQSNAFSSINRDRRVRAGEPNASEFSGNYSFSNAKDQAKKNEEYERDLLRKELSRTRSLRRAQAQDFNRNNDSKFPTRQDTDNSNIRNGYDATNNFTGKNYAMPISRPNSGFNGQDSNTLTRVGADSKDRSRNIRATNGATDLDNTYQNGSGGNNNSSGRGSSIGRFFNGMTNNDNNRSNNNSRGNVPPTNAPSSKQGQFLNSFVMPPSNVMGRSPERSSPSDRYGNSAKPPTEATLNGFSNTYSTSNLGRNSIPNNIRDAEISDVQRTQTGGQFSGFRERNVNTNTNRRVRPISNAQRRRQTMRASDFEQNRSQNINGSSRRQMQNTRQSQGNSNRNGLFNQQKSSSEDGQQERRGLFSRSNNQQRTPVIQENRSPFVQRPSSPPSRVQDNQNRFSRPNGQVSQSQNNSNRFNQRLNSQNSQIQEDRNRFTQRTTVQRQSFQSQDNRGGFFSRPSAPSQSRSGQFARASQSNSRSRNTSFIDPALEAKKEEVKEEAKLAAVGGAVAGMFPGIIVAFCLYLREFEFDIDSDMLPWIPLGLSSLGSVLAYRLSIPFKDKDVSAAEYDKDLTKIIRLYLAAPFSKPKRNLDRLADETKRKADEVSDDIKTFPSRVADRAEERYIRMASDDDYSRRLPGRSIYGRNQARRRN
eukprot:CAMPEP_0116063178 /NCGR_PEP_ID=MMETSP0322-20121206/8258_1 /TAXON_ID=163516 /ORGANISM="Leptocylindrus danicus var. apora, Strain B651" /LENGTH=733 /DNA_ID=CAMNT_0003548743 /DNA_START=361 /DNA_END=2562 /DNA_ORIENTATION=+